MTTQSVSATPTTAEVIRVAMEAMLLGKFKCRPGRIESYDAALQVANVKPMLKRRIAAAGGQELVEPLEVVPRVPVLFPRSRDFFITFPLAAGDYVLLVGVDQSIDAFTASQVGSDVDPDDFRWWDATDVVALPGFWPFAAALSDVSATSLVIGKTGGIQIHITGSDILLGGTAATDDAADAQKVAAQLNAIKTALTTFLVTNPAAAASFLDGGAAFVAAMNAIFASFPGSVAASNLKVKP